MRAAILIPHDLTDYVTSLSDPYGTPALQLRRPGSDTFETIPTPGDDPYQTEIDQFIDAVRRAVGRPTLYELTEGADRERAEPDYLV